MQLLGLLSRYTAHGCLGAVAIELSKVEDRHVGHKRGHGSELVLAAPLQVRRLKGAYALQVRRM